MVARGPRYAAMAAGEFTYISGSLCVNGHTSERETTSGRCIQCRRDAERESYPERYKTKISARNKSAENRAKFAERAAKFRANLPEEKMEEIRVKAKLKAREWRKNNPGHRNALKRKYVADKGKRTPAWADLNKIVDIYKNCPPGHHVDHIIPLRAKNVSGLHVHYNLQYLPAIENMRKNNRFAA
jgi:hypothetical protein